MTRDEKIAALERFTGELVDELSDFVDDLHAKGRPVYGYDAYEDSKRFVALEVVPRLNELLEGLGVEVEYDPD